MKKTVLVLIVLHLCIPAITFSQAIPPGPSFLADKHNEAGIACKGCHKDSSPEGQVDTVVCNGCHGNQVKLAERTREVDPNPHGSHLGDVKCELCHHAHRPSEDYCANCHNFGYKVP